MTIRMQAWLWAAAILVAAVVMTSVEMSDEASLIVVLGLSCAAWASLRPAKACKRTCLP